MHVRKEVSALISPTAFHLGEVIMDSSPTKDLGGPHITKK